MRTNKIVCINISNQWDNQNNDTYQQQILSNYSYTADSGLFLYFFYFSEQPSFYTELQKVVSLNKKRQCSPPEANQLMTNSINCLTYIYLKFSFSSIVLQDRTYLAGKPQKELNSFQQTFKKGPRGPFSFTDSYWKLLDLVAWGQVSSRKAF